MKYTPTVIETTTASINSAIERSPVWTAPADVFAPEVVVFVVTAPPVLPFPESAAFVALTEPEVASLLAVPIAVLSPLVISVFASVVSFSSPPKMCSIAMMSSSIGLELA